MDRLGHLLIGNWRNLADSTNAMMHGLRTCRLCWRITLGIFLVFIGVELVLLKVSADRYRAEQYATFEREALVVARSIVRMSEMDVGRHAFEEAGSALRDNSVLVGMRVFSESGIAQDSFGELTAIVPNTDLLVEEERKVVYRDRDRMEVIWPPSRLHAPYFVTAIVDISEVPALVNAYAERILWLVLVLAVIMTVVAMLLLEKLVLRPLRALNEGLRKVAENPANADRLVLESVGRDEMADLAQNFYTLTGRIGTECEERSRSAPTKRRPVKGLSAAPAN